METSLFTWVTAYYSNVIRHIFDNEMIVETNIETGECSLYTQTRILRDSVNLREMNIGIKGYTEMLLMVEKTGKF
jgi:hypothetical protein